jgi:phosphatidate cytidylyltransferase
MASASANSAASFRSDGRSGDVLLARIASSVVLVPLVLLAVWLGGWPFVAGVALVATWCTLEYARLLERAGYRPAWPVGLASAAAIATAPAVPAGAHLGALALGLAVLGPGVYFVAANAPVDRAPLDWALTTLGSLIVGWPLAQGVALREARLDVVALEWPAGPGLLLALVALTCTWASDTGAYAAGRLFGRRPFFAAISPRKTAEGAIAGVLAPTAVALAWSGALGWPLVFAAVLGAAAGCAAIAGDLLESALKRAVGAKDAGALIPGHGGLLDRIDSLLLVLVAVALMTGKAWP